MRQIRAQPPFFFDRPPVENGEHDMAWAFSPSGRPVLSCQMYRTAKIFRGKHHFRSGLEDFCKFFLKNQGTRDTMFYCIKFWQYYHDLLRQIFCTYMCISLKKRSIHFSTVNLDSIKCCVDLSRPWTLFFFFWQKEYIFEETFVLSFFTLLLL